MAGAAVVDVRDLYVRRGQATLLDGVSWQVARGQHWVVLGPNGCGKTSLLKVLMGFLSPSNGSISLLGHRHGRTDWREVRPLVGLVSSALHAHIPAAELALETVISGRYAQLDFWGRPTAGDIRAARAALARLDAAPLAEKPWAWLSQGERQRVLIARALIARPRLLILDEPCAGLDPVARTDFLGSVERLLREARGPTLLLVTHHVEEITPGFSHVLLLQAGGRVAASGTRSEVLTSSRLSAAFGRPLRLRHQRGRYQLDVT